MTIKNLLSALIIALWLCFTTWGFALWATGAKLDYRDSLGSGFIALRFAPQAGISYQWSYRSQSAWFWTPEGNWRLFPLE